MVHDLIEFVSGAEGATLAVLVFAMVFAESAILLDLVVPGEIGLVVGGAAAAYNDTPIVSEPMETTHDPTGGVVGLARRAAPHLHVVSAS